MDLVKRFEKMVTDVPNAVALIYKDQTMSYKTLNEITNRLGRYLLSHSVLVPGKIVGIHLNRSIESVISIMATLKAGLTFLPIDPTYPKSRVKFIVEDAKVDFLFTTSSFLSEIDFYQGKLFATDLQLDTLEESEGNLEEVEIQKDHEAYVIYTSGTTNVPKGVVVSRENISHYINWANHCYYNNEANHHLGLFTSLSFDLTMTSLFSAITRGASLTIFPEENISEIFKEVFSEKSDITAVKITPSHVELLKYMAIDTTNIDTVILGGETLRKDHVEVLKGLNGSMKVFNEYGPTETTVGCSVYEVEDATKQILIGKPIDGVQMYILNAKNRIQSVGAIGEIAVGGKGVAKGYLNRVELTDSKFINNPYNSEDRLYLTGDRGKKLKDGNFEFLGRKDSQLKVRGFRIEPLEICAVLNGHEDISQSQVFICQNLNNETTLVSALVPKSKSANQENVFEKKEFSQELASFCKQQLPDFMIPNLFLVLSEIPLTVNGKVDEKELVNYAQEELTAKNVEFVSDAKENQQGLLTIWQKVLGREHISVRHDFFSLGGDSLKAIHVSHEINCAYNVNIDVRTILENPTIEKLSVFLDLPQSNSLESIKSVPEQPYYDLSHAQKRLWVIDQSQELGSAYNISHSYHFENVQFDLFQKAFKKLIERHEILRTTFAMIEGEPKQIIHNIDDYFIPIERCGFDDEKSISEEINELISSQRKMTFNMEKGPLYRATLIHLGKDQYVFLLIIHHIISDAWSLRVMEKEFTELYYALSEERSANLIPLSIQYKDFTAWQNERLLDGTLLAAEKYWKAQYAHDLPVLDMPIDYPRPVIKSYNGGVVGFQIGEEISNNLKELCRQKETTLFVGLLASVKAILHRYTGQNDVIVGVPIVGRDHPDLENQLGFYVNTLALRTRFDGRNNFSELIEAVKQVVLNGYEHQEYPFDNLIDELDLKRDLSRSPLFDVMLNFNNLTETEPLSKPLSNDLEVEDHIGESQFEQDQEEGYSKFDLTFTFEEIDNKLNCNLNYNSDLFKRRTVEQIRDVYIELVTNLLKDETQSIESVDIVSQEDRTKLIHNLHHKSIGYPADTTIIDLFETQVEKAPANIALVFNNKEISYSELNNRSNQLANYLQDKLNLKADSLIGIKLDKSENMIVVILGVLKSGAAYVPIDPDYPEDRIEYILNDCVCELLIDDNELLNIESALSQYATNNLPKVYTSENLAYVIYTSGSTGKPKGVLVEHKNLVQLLRPDKPLFKFDSNDTWTLFHSYCFDFSVWEIFGSLTNGSKLVIIPKETSRDSSEFLKVLEEHEVTILNQTPASFYNLIERIGDFELKLSLRYVIFGGEMLKPIKLKKWIQRHPNTKLVNMYGITETTVHVTYKEVTQDEIDNNISNIGKPLPTLNCYVFDEKKKIMPSGMPGELYIGGAGVTRGYLNNKELTIERFVQNPYMPDQTLYRSGDKVKQLENGDFEYLGRIDDQVKIRGYRIELGEVENAILLHEQVESALVVLKKDEFDESNLVAYLDVKNDATIEDIKKYLSKRLPAYMIPSYFYKVNGIPLTSNGKIDKESLLDIKVEAMTTAIKYVAPRNKYEKDLAEMWSNVLGLDKNEISVEGDFFDLGGHSLKATRLVGMVYEKLGIKLPLSAMFLHPTIAELSQFLKTSSVEPFETLEAISDSSDHCYEASHIQQRFWVLNQFEENRLSYIIPLNYEIKGDIDISLFKESFQLLLERHEILRTTFFQNQQEQVIQKIWLDELDAWKLEYIDLRSEVSPMESAIDIAKKEANTPFDLTEPPLYRAKLLHIENGHFYLSLTFHHIIFDGWSINVFLRDWTQLYDALDKQTKANLPNLPIKYKDYSSWYNSRISKEGSNSWEYWESKLSGELPIIELSTDFQRPRIKSSNGRSIRFEIDRETSAKFKRLCKKYQTSTFVGILGIIKVLLLRYTGQKDLIVGSPVSGRTHPSLDNLIGVFINTLPFRSQIDPNGSFVDVLQAVHQTVVGAQEHQDYPFDYLVEKLNLRREVSRTTLFDIGFTWHASGIDNSDLSSPFHIAEAEIDKTISRSDLSFHGNEIDEQIHISIEYSTDLFKLDRIDRMASHINNLMQKILKKVDEPICLVDYFSNNEREQLAKYSGFNSNENLSNSTIKSKLIDIPDSSNALVVCDEYFQLLPLAVKGKLYVKKDNPLISEDLSPLKKEDSTPSMFEKNNYEYHDTGYIASWNDYGQLFISGRSNKRILTNGFIVQLEEVEDFLRNHDEVIDAVLLHDSDEMKGKISAYILPVNGRSISEGAIKNYCLDSLPAYMVPDAFYIVDDLAVNHNGTIDEAELLIHKDGISEKEQPISVATDGNEIRTWLVNVWTETLSHSSFDINDKFFDVGGNSLSIVKLNVLINEKFPDITITDLFTHTSISSLIEFIDSKQPQDILEQNGIEFPEDYYQSDPVPNSTEAQMECLEYKIEGQLFTSIDQYSKSHKISLECLFASLFAHALYEVIDEEAVRLNYQDENQDHVRLLTVDFSEINDSHDLYMNVERIISSVNESPIPERPKEAYLVQFDPTNTNVLIDFIRHENREDVKDSVDLNLQIGMNTSDFSIALSFNKHQFNDDKINDLMKIFLLTIESAVAVEHIQ